MWKPDPRRRSQNRRGAGTTDSADGDATGNAGAGNDGTADEAGPAEARGASIEGGERSDPASSRRRRPESTPAQRALGLLTRREHSRRELTRKLTARGVTREDAAAAVDKLAEAGWQNDDRFAGSIARTRVAAGFGPMRIRAELGMHGLDRGQVGAAIDACAVDWAQVARTTLGRRFPVDALKDAKQRRKAIDFLLRRGFDHSTAHAAVGHGGGSSGDEAPADD